MTSTKKPAGLFEFIEERTIGVGQLEWIIEKEWLESKNIKILTEFIDEKTVIKVKWPNQKRKLPEAK